MIGVFAGSFCPITSGHLDAITRAAKIVDKLYVVVGYNEQKKYLLSDEDRLDTVKYATRNLANVEVRLHKGMTTDFCKQVGATVMVKAVRNSTELQDVVDLSSANKQFWDGETVFIVADKRYQFLSSSLVRELISLGQDVSQLVPEGLAERFTKLLG